MDYINIFLPHNNAITVSASLFSFELLTMTMMLIIHGAEGDTMLTLILNRFFFRDSKPAGGHVYRGQQFSEVLGGAYLFADVQKK